MNSSEAWSMFIGIMLPLLIAAIQQWHWSNTKRTVVGVLVSMLVGVITSCLQGDFTGKDVGANMLIVLTSSMTAYRNIWKPLGVSSTIETSVMNTQPQTEEGTNAGNT